jgi:hypothetical protein
MSLLVILDELVHQILLQVVHWLSFCHSRTPD